IIDGWNRLEFKLPTVDTHIPGVGKIGGWSLGTPNIPRLATGGVVTSPTLALIGEAGPEAVIPLSQFNGAGGSSSYDGLALARAQASQIVALAAFTFGSILILAGDFHDRVPSILLDAFRKITTDLTAAVDKAADDV